MHKHDPLALPHSHALMGNTASTTTGKKKTNVTLWNQPPHTTCLAAFFVYEDEPSSELDAALNLVNPTRWSLLRLHIDDPIAVSFRVVKLPSLILYDTTNHHGVTNHAAGSDEDDQQKMVETARVFGTQNIIEMIGRVFHE